MRNQCVFTGYGEAVNGAATIPGSEAKLKATFTVNFIMLDESVRVIFIINPNKNPEDKEENNKVELTIKGLHYEVQEAQYILNYDELSKDIEHNLAGGSISGELDPPGNDGYWHEDYNMTGGLPIDINVSALGGRTALQGANVKEGTNEPVDEPSTSVTRSPIIKGKIVRPDYHDDPEGGIYHANGEVVNKMIAYYNKSRGNNLSRVYRYHYDHSVRSGTDSKGNPTYSTCTSCSSVYATATGNGRFQPGEDKIAIKALIYNGRSGMPHVDARDFLKEIEDNTSDSLNKTIYWESEKYPMKVQRWMKHVILEDKIEEVEEKGKDEEGNETTVTKKITTTETKEEWVPVEGQYDRIFSHQNVAQIKWGTNESLQQAYQDDRRNAANRKRDKGSYEKAPFATDRELQGYDYPFKSGYYFNPAGEYTLTIHTEIYKDEQKETEEHKALVDRLIESFRYGSTMKYIDTDRLLLAIDDASVGDTVYSDDKFLEVEKDYQYVKDFEIPHWPDESGYTHDYFKEILEGHEESNTGDSKDDYNYKEYIKEGDIFRIIEETTITFKVNPENMNRYTYGGMKNGIYYNTVWAEDTDLSDITNVKNMKLIGVNKDTPLDLMEITVQGSMYDDLNNN